MGLCRFIVLALLLLSSSALAQERIALRLTDWADPEEVPLDQRSIALFKQQHSNIDILYEPNPGRQYEEKILTALAADAPPDVFLLDSKLIPTFTNKKVLLDLAPLVAELQVDTTQWFPNVLAIARRGSALFAFPKGFTPLMVYYNKRLFREAGIPPPPEGWTWNDYLAIARRLTIDQNGDGIPEQYGTAFTNYYFNWIPWIWSAGGDVVDSTGHHATGVLNSPQTEAAFRFLIGLRTEEHVAPDVGTWVQAEKTGATNALFANGRLGMIVDGHWRMPKFRQYIREGALDIGVAPFPRHPGGRKVNVMYESGWCVPVNSRHPREAALLAAFMAGQATSRIRTAQGLEIPAVISVAREMVAADTTGMEKAFVDEVPFCRQPWGSIIERFSEVEWTLQDAVDEVMVSGQPLHETMTAYAARVDRQMENIRSSEDYTFSPIASHAEILDFLAGAIVILFIITLLLYLRERRRNRPATRTALFFLAPSLLHLVVFVFTPIAFAAWLSLHRWDIIVADKPFIGLANFRDMFGDPDFWNALRNTVVYTLNVPLSMALSLIVALLMHRRLHALGFLRTLYFLPSVSSFVAIALVWMWIYHPTFGAANFVLGIVGIPPLQWLNSAQTAMLSVIVFSVWLGIGYQMVIFLAGLQSIPEELYEAARIDGAGPWTQFWRVTWPLLRPTTFFILVTSAIASFQVFTSIYVMTAGGPVRSTDVIVYHVYQAAWEQLRMGYASAMALVLFLIIMVVTWLQFKFIGRDLEYSG